MTCRFRSDFAFVLVEDARPRSGDRPAASRRSDGLASHAGDALRIGFSTDGLTVTPRVL